MFVFYLIKKCLPSHDICRAEPSLLERAVPGQLWAQAAQVLFTAARRGEAGYGCGTELAAGGGGAAGSGSIAVSWRYTWRAGGFIHTTEDLSLYIVAQIFCNRWFLEPKL